MFKVTTDNFEYEPASPGLGESPTYLVTPRNPDGLSIELHYRFQHLPKEDFNGRRILVGAWHLTEYDRNDDAMDTAWFADFAAADKHAKALWDASYDHDATLYGSTNPEPENYKFGS